MEDTTLGSFPGWSDNSWGYHTDDGHKYYNSSTLGEAYGELACAGDVIGCRVDLDMGDLSFNRGSIHFGRASVHFLASAYVRLWLTGDIGIAFTGVKGCLFPVVAMDTPGTKLRVNFGASASPLRYRES